MSKNLPIIDHQTIEDCYFGDMELLAEVVGVFLEQKDIQVRELDEACASGDPRRVSEAAHKLKGGLLTIGAAATAEVARQLESQGRKEDLSQVARTQACLHQEMERLLPALSELLAAA